MFSRRKINVNSLNVSPSHLESISRFTIVINETEEVVGKIVRQIQKQIEVLKTYYNSGEEIVYQELALYKVATDVVSEEVQVERLLRKYGASTVSITKNYTVFAAVGHDEEIVALVKEFEPYGLIEFIRSGRVAIIKSSETIHKELSEFEQLQPGEQIRANGVLNQKENIFSL